MPTRLKLSLSAALAFTLLTATFALAHTVGFDDGVIDSAKEIHGTKHHQHGETDGHLPAEDNENIDLVSKLKLKNVVPEKIADVSVYGNYAYLAAWGVVTCKYNGVHVVNIADPENPKEVSFIGSKEGSYPGEGVQALKIDTPAYSGKILVTNNETCNEKTGFGGMNIYDISKPNQPVPLAEGIGDFTVNGQGKKAANEIHSVFAWDAGDKAYAVIVDNEEEKDVDIVDITNPKRPRKIVEYDLDQQFPQIKEATSDDVLFEIFHHDVVVKKIGSRWEMLVSYWDGGYVKLDVTDPMAATYIGDTDFGAVDPQGVESGLLTGLLQPVPPEGNGHEAEFTKDNQYVVAADEDFDPYNLVAENVDDGTAINGGQGDATPPLTEGQQITGPGIYVGLACPGGTPVPPGGAGTQIAVVERGVCFFTEKVAEVEAAGGYEAILVFNRTAEDGCSTPLNMAVEGDTPTFGVATRLQGFQIFDIEDQYDEAECVAGDGTQTAPLAIPTTGDTLNFESYFDGWGYVRLFENEDGKMTELDTYAIPQAHDDAFAEGFGDLSVHEVATSKLYPERQYYSYYSGGVRVTEIQGDQLVEVGEWIDPVGGSNFWGIEAFTRGTGDQKVEYFAGSDRDHGLYIFQYTGD